ncbi:MAG: hypothetical protein Rpha_1952 [Candidatus Ruthia sp. Apha_13_S6]|nr:hypothetical protein [Candidatus Ruthia sp. Apha_13_S6]
MEILKNTALFKNKIQTEQEKSIKQKLSEIQTMLKSKQ